MNFIHFFYFLTKKLFKPARRRSTWFNLDPAWEPNWAGMCPIWSIRARELGPDPPGSTISEVRRQAHGPIFFFSKGPYEDNSCFSSISSNNTQKQFLFLPPDLCMCRLYLVPCIQFPEFYKRKTTNMKLSMSKSKCFQLKNRNP